MLSAGFGAALLDANKSIELDATFVKVRFTPTVPVVAAPFCFWWLANSPTPPTNPPNRLPCPLPPWSLQGYYRRASANFQLGKFKDALKDYEAVCKVRPNDKDAVVKFKECKKLVHRLAFERAISVKGPQEKSVSERLTALIASIRDPDDKYDGPRLGDAITLEFVDGLVERFTDQKTLHRKYALEILLRMAELLQTLPTLTDVPIAPGGKVTVCGDTHGQFYDLKNIFKINGAPSEDNPYLFNGDFVDRGSFSTEVVFTLFAYKLLYPKHFHVRCWGRAPLVASCAHAPTHARSWEHQLVLSIRVQIPWRRRCAQRPCGAHPVLLAVRPRAVVQGQPRDDQYEQNVRV